MATVNVRSDVSDAFYRYKMPRLLAKIEGKGNGIKTVIPNIPDIGRCLKRPPHYATKFFGCELGAHVQFDPKNDRYIVYGAHDASDLQMLLDGFIKKFVLCESCGNPETELHVSGNSKDQTLWKTCKACGNRNMADMRHKLISYILKNPPSGFAEYYGGKAGEVNRDGTAVVDSSGAGKRTKKKKSKKSRDKDEDSPKEDLSVNGSATINGASGSPELSAIDQEAMPDVGTGLDFGGSGELLGAATAGLSVAHLGGLASLQPASKPKKSSNASKDHEEDSDSDWAEDTSEAAMKKRMADLTKVMNTNLVLGEEDPDEAKDVHSPTSSSGKKKSKSKKEKAPMSPIADEDEASMSGDDEALDKFAEFISGFVGEDESVTPATPKQVKNKLAEFQLKPAEAVLVYMQVSFTKHMIKSKEIEAHAANLRAITADSEVAQKALLGGLERFLGETGKKLLPKTPIILKKLYDEDVVDEEVLKKWGAKASKKYVKKDLSKEIRKKAEPFLEWLEQDDDGSEDDDE